MPLPLLAIRRTAVAIALVLLVVAASWWILWSVAAAQYRGVIDNWISVQHNEGVQVEYDSRQTFGFPNHVVMRFVNLRWKNADGIGFHADDMDLSSTPWRWQVYDARFKGRVEIAAPLDADGRALTLGGESGSAHVELNTDGVWRLSRVELIHAAVGRAPDYLFLADKLDASAERPDLPPKDHTQPGLTLKGEAKRVTLPQAMPTPFGPKMAELEASLRVMGETPDFRKQPSMAAWNNASGIVEFDELYMEWGPLRLTAKGALGFDDDLQPEGAFAGTIGHHEDVLKALMEHEFIAKRQAGMLNSALSLFAKPSGGSSGIEVPIAVQLGGLFLGPVRVFTFPEIEWPKADAPPPPAEPMSPQPSN